MTYETAISNILKVLKDLLPTPIPIVYSGDLNRIEEQYPYITYSIVSAGRAEPLAATNQWLDPDNNTDTLHTEQDQEFTLSFTVCAKSLGESLSRIEELITILRYYEQKEKLNEDGLSYTFLPTVVEVEPFHDRSIGIEIPEVQKEYRLGFDTTFRIQKQVEQQINVIEEIEEVEINVK